jgi:HEAT repeat protein
MLNEALKNDKTQYWACVGLTELGPKAAPAVTNLTEIVDDDEEEVRLQAMLALAEIGEAAQPAAAELIKALADPQIGVRYAAAFALGSIRAEGADTALEQQAQTDDKFLEILSVWALARTNPDDEDRQRTAVTLLLEGINDPDERTRAASIRALAQLDAPEDMRSQVFEKFMASPYPEVMPAAMDAVAARGAEMVERVAARLADPKTRIHAVRVLGRMGPEAKDAVPQLVAALEDSEPELGGEINFALGAIGPDASAAVPALTAMVNDENDSLRYSAVFALGEIGPAAAEATSALVGNVKNPKEKDPFLTFASALALSRIHPDNERVAKRVVPILITGLKHERANVRMETAHALGDIGEEAKSATAALREALDDADEQVRSAAATALGMIE